MRYTPRLSELRACEPVPFDRADFLAQMAELGIPPDRAVAECDKQQARHNRDEADRVARQVAWVEKIRREGVPSSAKPAGMLWNGSH